MTFLLTGMKGAALVAHAAKHWKEPLRSLVPERLLLEIVAVQALRPMCLRLANHGPNALVEAANHILSSGTHPGVSAAVAAVVDQHWKKDQLDTICAAPLRSQFIGGLMSQIASHGHGVVEHRLHQSLVSHSGAGPAIAAYEMKAHGVAMSAAAKPRHATYVDGSGRKRAFMADDDWVVVALEAAPGCGWVLTCYLATRGGSPIGREAERRRFRERVANSGFSGCKAELVDPSNW